MPRYALKIEYHGGPFSGWQRQHGLSTVQGALEAALARFDPAAPLVQAAGRTDAGVHATGQVAHVDLSRSWDPFRLSGAVNFHLKPLPVAIVAAAEVPEDFHARFNATWRRYLFRVISRHAPLVHQAGLAWQVRGPLDADKMRAAAAQLIGHHDFTTFRATMCQAPSPMKTLDSIGITEHALPHGTEFQFHLQARSFLHNQVRSIVGTLERAGMGAWSPEDVRNALLAQDRAACGPVAPPEGLYLAQVSYPTDPFARSVQPRETL